MGWPQSAFYGALSKSHDANDFAGSSFAASAATTYSTTGNEVLKTAYEYYNDTQLWIIEHYPNSVAAQTYMKAAAALENNGLDVRPYLGNGGYYTFAYFPLPVITGNALSLSAPRSTKMTIQANCPKRRKCNTIPQTDGPAAVRQRQLRSDLYRTH